MLIVITENTSELRDGAILLILGVIRPLLISMTLLISTNGFMCVV